VDACPEPVEGIAHVCQHGFQFEGVLVADCATIMVADCATITAVLLSDHP